MIKASPEEIKSLEKLGSIQTATWDVITDFIDREPQPDNSNKIHKIAAYLCKGKPCEHHIQEAQNILELIKND